MGFLKGLGTFICGFLLFLALSVFSMAFMLHSTILSSDFVTKQVNKIDISSVARDIVEEQISPELPAEDAILKDVVVDIISEQEPWIKEQLTNAIDTGYDFFLGKTDTLAITIPLADLKVSLKETIWEDSQEYLAQQLSGMSDYDIQHYLQDYMAQIPPENLPPQLAALPEDERNAAIEQYLRDFAGLAMTAPVPPAISGQFESLMRQYFDQYYDEFISQVPDSFVIDRSKIGSDNMDALFTVRKYIGYFQAVYWWLIVFMVVMAGLIFLINRNIKVTTRTLGIDLLVFGVLEVGGALVAKALSPTSLIPDFSQIPASLQNVIDSVFKDIASIALTFGIGVLVVGAVLLVVSIVVKRKEEPAKP